MEELKIPLPRISGLGRIPDTRKERTLALRTSAGGEADSTHRHHVAFAVLSAHRRGDSCRQKLAELRVGEEVKADISSDRQPDSDGDDLRPGSLPPT